MSKKVKFLKIKGHSAAFLKLGARVDRCKEGAWVFWGVGVNDLQLRKLMAMAY